MPGKPPSICGQCGVRVLDGGRWCPAHQEDNRVLKADRERSVFRRNEELKRLYDRWAWRGRQGARRFVLARDPLCTIRILCGGRAFSTDVDHIIRAELYIEQHGGDETFFFDPENLRGACHEDHTHKTALENRGGWNESLVPQNRF